MKVSQLVSVARGDMPADLLLRNGRVINVFSGRIEEADIAIAHGKIAGLGSGYRATQTLDLDGRYVAPGLIDAHVHIESSLCTPASFADIVVPRGVTTVVADPHEIANVAGIEGIRYMAQAGSGLALHIYMMGPSCVPATHMGTNGGALEADDLAPLLADGTLTGLAEVMNYPGVVGGHDDVLAKLALFRGRPIDGHAPALSGMALNAYAAAGVGSEHECTTPREAAEKLARGLVIFIREATNARNLRPLLPLVTPENSRRICLCTDDRIAADLLEEGSVDHMVREAIAWGLDPMVAFQMATLNPAEWFGLNDRGAIAPGRAADLFVFEQLDAPQAHQVFVDGQLVAEGGTMCSEKASSSTALPSAVGNSVHVNWRAVDLRVPARGSSLRVIGLIEDQIVTEERVLPVTVVDGHAVADPMRDLLKMAVIDRHPTRQRNGDDAAKRPSVGLGFIQGMGLKSGAIAGTVAHDHHNLVVIGVDDDDMLAAGRAVTDMGGGIVVIEAGQVVAALPLPVAGLMSDRPAAAVGADYGRLLAAAASLGSRLRDPFMAMSFMALEVVPKLKLTDQGLVDVEKFDFVDLFV